MMSSNNTRVLVPAETLRTSRGSTNPYEDDIPKPQGRIPSDARTKKGFCRPKKHPFGQLSSRREETDKHMNGFDISVTFIQKHRQIHLKEDPHIKATRIDRSMMFTASATHNWQDVAVGGVGVVVKYSLLQNLVSITKITDRITHALFKGTLKLISYHAIPRKNVSDETDVEELYENVNHIFPHVF